MPFIPHTDDDQQQMLKAIGVDSIDALFDEIPAALRCEGFTHIPPALTEMQISRLMNERAAEDQGGLSFLGAGAYEHHIPAAVWEITTRGEFYSAYTPYQAEASQGTLQVIYEYQTMISSLLGLDVSNASLYDGATALAEAVLMAVRANRRSRSRRILMPRAVHPYYRHVVRAITHTQGIHLTEVPFDLETGRTELAALAALEDDDFAALVIPQPNFFGVLEDANALTDWARQRDILVIGAVNPTAMALLQPPGLWGAEGAHIACGEGQPLGVPLSSGGPYFGFLACQQALVRQMPGRIVGRTLDLEGKQGFTLTLQAREQHIRRSKATSNICTNQGLMVTAATIYMSLLGPQGLMAVASQCHGNLRGLLNRLDPLSGVTPVFQGPRFHEAVLKLDRPVPEVLAQLDAQGIVGGVDLSEW
ncbi:MAG: aminomethyl-transferring glycine dehydrogenase subunit GcvPA, partial [Gammaproteobacteria bacterium]